MSSTLKRCRDCGETKAVGAFYTHPETRDGYRNSCKACCNTRVMARSNLMMDNESYRERKRAQRRKAAVKARALGYRRKRDKNAAQAHNLVNYAIETGALLPPRHCEECGHDFSDFRREAHHEDYAKPLVVCWLCSRCHGKRHRTVAVA